MRILVYGAGAMGTSLGAFLTRGGYPCDLVTRNREHVAALQSGGAVLCCAAGTSVVPVSACLPEEMTGQYDVIFLATRQRENGATARFLLPYLKEDGALVCVQNGLPEEELAEVFGEYRVYGCALGWGAEQIGAGRIRLTSEEETPHLAFGAYGAGDRSEELSKMLSSAFSVTAGDLREIRYSKLVVNAAFSTLSAISGLTFGELAKKHKKLVLSLMRETVAVAQAEGCKNLVQNGHDIGKLFKSPFAGILLPFAMKKHSAIRSGMLKDLEAGRRCDVDFVAGAVAGAGKKRGIPTPKLCAAVALVHAIENGLAELSPESLKLI